MRLPFLDREKERARIVRAVRSDSPSFVVVYGRRRCGKSRLLQEVVQPETDVYYLADLREPPLQRRSLAAEVARLVPHFDEAEYPDWQAFFSTWRERADDGSCLVIDEFPHLVQLSPELPSVLQRLLDTPGDKALHLVVCGSSQRMMHGLVMDSTAPLYGRATEALRIRPLPARWITRALDVHGCGAIEAYAVWGGSPRNWELASDFPAVDTAVRELVLDRDGVLHDEPRRLLLDDMRSAVQPHSILSLVGAGCHRVSEIASRLGKPVSSLSRPMALLTELEHVDRETPFGESPRSSKRALYKLADPFLQFWYRYVLPNESLLAVDLVDAVYERIVPTLPEHVGQVWEELARMSVPELPLHGTRWGPARRWWGTDLRGVPHEIDVVAESLDRKLVLVGEAKWTEAVNAARLAGELRRRAEHLPFVRGRPVLYALWTKRRVRAAGDIPVVVPEDVLG